MNLPRRITVRTTRVLGFTAYYGWLFLVSNATVLREVLTPRHRARPAIVQLTLRCRTPVEIVSLANLISLTPGTLALEMQLDPPTLYVHGMFAIDSEVFLTELRELEARMLTAMRPADQPPVPYRDDDPVDRR